MDKTHTKGTGPNRSNLGVWLASGVSAIWLVSCVSYLIWSGKDGSSFWKLTPNEFGDLFAGIAAPLAFLWLALAVFLQKSELEEQRKELRATREELSLTRELQIPEKQKQQIQDHFEDLFRLILQLRILMRSQHGKHKGTLQTFFAYYTHLSEGTPDSPAFLHELSNYCDLIDSIEGIAEEVAKEFSKSDLDWPVFDKFDEISRSLDKLAQRLINSEAAADFTSSYISTVHEASQRTLNILRKVQFNSSQDDGRTGTKMKEI